MKAASGLVAVLAGVGLLASAGVASAGDSAGKKADVQLEQKVEKQLQQDLRLARQPVSASVKKGVVTLSGTVDTVADKVRAEQIAGLVGAAKIDNRLAVVETSDDGSDPNRKAPPQEQEERRALSDPHRKDPLVGAMPAEQTGSREIRLRTTGMPDPVLEKREAEKRAAEKSQVEKHEVEKKTVPLDKTQEQEQQKAQRPQDEHEQVPLPRDGSAPR